MKKASKKSFLVIGCGRFGLNIVKTLAAMNCDVLAVDISEDRAEEAAEFVSNCMICDATDLSVLQEIGAGEMDHGVIAIGGNLQATILVLVNLQKCGVKQITVRADDKDHREIYERLGATEVMIPEEASGEALAYQIMSDSVLDYYRIEGDYSIVKISVGKGFSPASIKDLDVRKHFGVSIAGIIRNDVFMIPNGDDVITPDDVLAVVGSVEDYQRFDVFLNPEPK